MKINIGLYTCLLVYSWSRVILEKLTGFKLVKKLPTFYGTRRFITAFTSARHLSASWANSIQSIPPHPTSWRSILILSSHLRLVLPNGLFPSRFPTKILYSLSSPPYLHAPPIILLDFIPRTVLGEEYRSLSSPLCNFIGLYAFTYFCMSLSLVLRLLLWLLYLELVSWAVSLNCFSCFVRDSSDSENLANGTLTLAKKR